MDPFELTIIMIGSLLCFEPCGKFYMGICLSHFAVSLIVGDIAHPGKNDLILNLIYCCIDVLKPFVR